MMLCSSSPKTCHIKPLSHSLCHLFSLPHHHHHQVPDLEQTLAAMPLQTSLSSDNFKKFKPLLCPPVAELQRLSRNVIRCLPLSRLPSTLPVKDKNSKPLLCLLLLNFRSTCSLLPFGPKLWPKWFWFSNFVDKRSCFFFFASFKTDSFAFVSVHAILLLPIAALALLKI